MNRENILKLKIQIYEKDSDVCYFVYDDDGYGQEYSGVTLEWIIDYLEMVLRCNESIKGKELVP